MLHFFATLKTVIAGLLLSAATFMSPAVATHNTLGLASSFNPVQAAPAYLSGAGISGVATSVALTAFSTRQGTPITTTDIGGIGYITIDPGTSKEENVSFTGITQNSNGTAVLTGVTRGLSDVYPYGSSSTLSVAHSGGATVITANSAAYYSQFNIAVNSSTITGLWTFASTSLPRVTSDTSIAQMAANTSTLASVAYVNQVATSGAPAASVGTPGLVLLGSSAQIQHGTDGTPTHYVPPTSLFNSVASTTAYIGVVAQNTLDSSFIGTSSLSTAVLSYLLPAGTIQMYASSTAPTGWLLANGQLVSTSTYSALFALIGYAYGGSTSTFAVPDMRGRAVFGPSSTISTTLGTTGGATSSAVSISVSQTTGTNIDCHNLGGCLAGTAYANQNTTNTIPILNPYIIENFIIKT